MKYFVYFCDGCNHNEDIGIQPFDTRDLAFSFIEQRLNSKGLSGKLSDYMLIQGDVLKLKSVETITKVDVDYSY